MICTLRRLVKLCLFVLVIAANGGCDSSIGGDGQGQPAYTPRTAVTAKRVPMHFTSIFVAHNPNQRTPPVSNPAYVSFTNDGTAAVDFAQHTFSLVSNNVTMSLDPNTLTVLKTPLAPSQSVAITDAALGLFSQGLGFPRDQLILVDENFTVYAYAAWDVEGAATTPVSPITANALQAGAITAATDNLVAINPNNALPNTSVTITPPTYIVTP